MRRLIESQLVPSVAGPYFTWTCPQCGQSVADNTGTTINQRRANTALAILYHECATSRKGKVMTLHPTDVARLAAERVHLQSQIDPICDRIEEINNELRDSLAPGTHNAGPLTVTVKQGSRFDKTAFTKANPVNQHPDWYEAVPKLATIKNALAPDVLDKYYTPNKPSVVIS